MIIEKKIFKNVYSFLKNFNYICIYKIKFFLFKYVCDLNWFSGFVVKCKIVMDRMIFKKKC